MPIFEATAIVKIKVEVEPVGTPTASRSRFAAAQEIGDILVGIEKVSGGRIRIWEYAGTDSVEEVQA